MILAVAISFFGEKSVLSPRGHFFKNERAVSPLAAAPMSKERPANPYEHEAEETPGYDPQELQLHRLLEQERIDDVYFMLCDLYENDIWCYLKSNWSHLAIEDIFQEVFLSIFEALQRRPAIRRFRSWMLGICRNRAVDYLRWSEKGKKAESERVEASVHSSERLSMLSPEVLTSRKQQIAMVQQGINSLSQEQQELLHLFYTQGCRQTEIADILGVTVQTVKMRLFHTRGALKQHLKAVDSSPTTNGSRSV